MDPARREPPPAPKDAPFVEMGRDGLDSDRPAFVARGKGEDFADDRGLGLINDEHLLLLIPPLLLDLDPIAEGRVGTVPETLAGVFAHRPMGMLGVLARLMLVEDVEHLAKEVATSVVAHVLRDRNQLYASLSEFAHVEFGVKSVAAEAAQRVDNDAIERVVGTLRLEDHFLEARPIIIKRRCPGLREDFDNFPTLPLAIGTALADLVG